MKIMIFKIKRYHIVKFGTVFERVLWGVHPSSRVIVLSKTFESLIIFSCSVKFVFVLCSFRVGVSCTELSSLVLSPNLKTSFFSQRVKKMKALKVREYSYTWGRMSTPHRARSKTVPNLTLWYLLILKIIIFIYI